MEARDRPSSTAVSTMAKLVTSGDRMSLREGGGDKVWSEGQRSEDFSVCEEGSVNSPDEESAIEDEDGLDYQWRIGLNNEELTLV